MSLGHREAFCRARERPVLEVQPHTSVSDVEATGPQVLVSCFGSAQAHSAICMPCSSWCLFGQQQTLPHAPGQLSRTHHRAPCSFCSKVAHCTGASCSRNRGPQMLESLPHPGNPAIPSWHVPSWSGARRTIAASCHAWVLAQWTSLGTSKAVQLVCHLLTKCHREQGTRPGRVATRD